MPRKAKSEKTEVVILNPGHRFPEGHPRYGGRKRNNAAHARAIAEEMGCDPLRFMLEVVRDGTATKLVVGEDGKKKRVTIEASLELRCDLAKHVSKFLHPTLSAQAVQAQVDVEATTNAVLPIDQIMNRPALAEALGELALLCATQGLDDTKFLPGPEADRVIGD